MQWASNNDVLQVADYKIMHPMLYWSQLELDNTETSCIDLDLPVLKSPNIINCNLGSRISYKNLRPSMRGQYLQWLADGKNGPLNEIDFAFLYFHGLERRALVDKEDLDIIIPEVKRLLIRYSDYSSFYLQLSQFIAHIAALYDFLALDQGGFLWYFDKIPQKHYSVNMIAVIFSWFSINNLPLPVNFIYEVIRLQIPQKLILKNSEEQFKSLFIQKFNNQFGDGLKIIASSTRILTYDPANPSLWSNMEVSIPEALHVFNNSHIFKIVQIWKNCLTELQSSIMIGDNPKTEAHGNITALSSISGSTIDSKIPSIPDEDFSDNEAIAKDITMTELNNVAEESLKVTTSDSAPVYKSQKDTGYINSKPATFDEVIPMNSIIRHANALSDLQEVSYDNILDEEYEGLLSLLTADFKPIYDNIWQKTAKPMSRPGELIPPREKVPIDITIDDAALTRIMADTEEVSHIIDGVLSESGAEVDSDHTDEEIWGPNESGAKGRENTRQQKHKAAEVTIDDAALIRIMADTEEVSRIIDQALYDSGVETDNNTIVCEVPIITNPTIDPNLPFCSDKLESLDGKFHAILVELLTKQEWSSNELAELAKKYHTMPFGMLDAINTWADEALGDILIEDGDVYTINLYLLEEQK